MKRLIIAIACIVAVSCGGGTSSPASSVTLKAASIAVDVAAQAVAGLDQASQVNIVNRATSREQAELELARYRMGIRSSVTHAAGSIKRRVDWVIDQAIANDRQADAMVDARWPKVAAPAVAP